MLQDVSFTARRGDVVALVGASGAGKSTLVDLIPRFNEPTQGRIRIDDVDTREVALPSLRRLIGIVSQDTVLFNDTVRNNIAYGVGERFTDAQVEAAARAANAHEFIAALPDGYATMLGERGTRLSGGQRQRLAIARALLVDAPILILDEATSALDTESERLVQEALQRLMRPTQASAIAHDQGAHTNLRVLLVDDSATVRLAFQKLLEYITQYSVPKLVLLSSANVYGPQPDNAQFLDEDAPLLGGEVCQYEASPDSHFIVDRHPGYGYRRFARDSGKRVAFNAEARARFLSFATGPAAAWSANFRDLGARYGFGFAAFDNAQVRHATTDDPLYLTFAR